MTRKKTIRTKTVKILLTKKQRIARMGKMARTEKMARMEKIAKIVRTVKIKIRRKRKRRSRKMPICLYNKVGTIAVYFGVAFFYKLLSKLAGTDCWPEFNNFFYIQYYLLTVSFICHVSFTRCCCFGNCSYCHGRGGWIWNVLQKYGSSGTSLSPIIYFLVLICIVPVVSDLCC